MSEEVYEHVSECSSDCSSCSASCDSRKPSKEDFLAPMNAYSRVKKIIGVVSGKGGVGKSFVTSYMATLMNRKGYETAVLDADITGPSIPKAFGLKQKAVANELGIIPCVSKNGTKVMSVNLLLDDEETPVVWRGPVIASTVKQFWSDVVWGDVDYMFVDMPPGTGDVPLTVFQSIPLDGILIVTTPQELVSMIVGKAVNMAKAMDIPILGIIENYSYISCGNCGEKIRVFGESHVEETARKYQLPVLAELPINPQVASAIDAGDVEGLMISHLDMASYIIEQAFVVAKKKTSAPMVVAVTTDENNNVYGHFGHCKNFTVYEFEDNKLKEKKPLLSDGNGHDDVVNTLIQNGINVVLCGGIGASAMDLLMKAGILVVPGMQGDIDVAVSTYLDGAATSSNSANCNHKEEEHSCGSSCGSSCGGCCH